ncbi:MAG: hypothetical protein J0L87_12820 [Bacteroidetes bacterium]|nr:hypothetical protein [Bacteroidota bacterium]
MKQLIKLKLIRDVTKQECRWLKRDFLKGEIVYLFAEDTYGCTGEDGIPCSLNGNTPSFELPKNSVMIHILD